MFIPNVSEATPTYVSNSTLRSRLIERRRILFPTPHPSIDPLQQLQFTSVGCLCEQSTTKMMINRHYVLPALLALAARNADAFAPISLAPNGRQTNVARFSMVAPSDVNVDVSVDYDAAAKLAYSDWCEKYGKDASDEKFATFKANYELVG